MVQLLLGHGADINYAYSRGSSPLLTAIWRRNVDAVKVLVRNGADMKLKKSWRQTETPLSLARSMSSAELVVALLDSLPAEESGLKNPFSGRTDQ